jgi:hypothetical protein
MYSYICCRCLNCTAQIVLEDRAGSDAIIHRPPRPRAGREACPYCRTVFVPPNYYVKESEVPLLMGTYHQPSGQMPD